MSHHTIIVLVVTIDQHEEDSSAFSSSAQIPSQTKKLQLFCTNTAFWRLRCSSLFSECLPCLLTCAASTLISPLVWCSVAFVTWSKRRPLFPDVETHHCGALRDAGELKQISTSKMFTRHCIKHMFLVFRVHLCRALSVAGNHTGKRRCPVPKIFPLILMSFRVHLYREHWWLLGIALENFQAAPCSESAARVVQSVRNNRSKRCMTGFAV